MTNIAVAVPLRDEQQGLPHLVAALRAQAAGGWSRIRVHLLFDGLDPAEAPTVARLTADPSPDEPVSFAVHVVARRAEPSAGRARRKAVALALADASAPDLVLTTDGDTVPASDWVSSAVAALGEVDCVAGHVARDDAVPLPARDALEAYLEELHRMRRNIDPIEWDPAPSHPWVGAANLALRACAYRSLGGFSAVASGEDRALVDLARRRGMKVRQSREVRVTTSSRLEGRIEGGLASALAHMARERTEPVVEHPADAARQYARHAWARRLRDRPGKRPDWHGLARELRSDADGLRELAARLPNGEAFAMCAVPIFPTERSLPLSEAARVLCDLDAGAFRLG